MNIIIMGPQGSGKGVLSRHLNSKYGFALISSGDILREEIKKGTKLGKQIADIINKGNLFPDELTLELLKKKIRSSRQGFILDGYPRNLNQVKLLEEHLESIGKDIDLVIYIDVPDSLCIERISGRWICRNCGAIYNTKTIPPKMPGICDKCGKALYQRADEKKEAVEQRLQIFHEKTQPLKNYYKEKGLLKVIDGTGSPKEVLQNAISIIESFK
ncbi:adenylate kinase [Candidatus Woesearchaeota archaeon]|nr:adenylate kinase [Candidatus Woesearchaeota archaeon]